MSLQTQNIEFTESLIREIASKEGLQNDICGESVRRLFGGLVNFTKNLIQKRASDFNDRSYFWALSVFSEVCVSIYDAAKKFNGRGRNFNDYNHFISSFTLACQNEVRSRVDRHTKHDSVENFISFESVYNEVQVQYKFEFEPSWEIADRMIDAILKSKVLSEEEEFIFRKEIEFRRKPGNGDFKKQIPITEFYDYCLSDYIKTFGKLVEPSTFQNKRTQMNKSLKQNKGLFESRIK